MVVTLVKPPPSYLDMPVLRLDNIALALRQILRFGNDRTCMLPPLAQAGAQSRGPVGASSGS